MRTILILMTMLFVAEVSAETKIVYQNSSDVDRVEHKTISKQSLSIVEMYWFIGTGIQHTMYSVGSEDYASTSIIGALDYSGDKLLLGGFAGIASPEGHSSHFIGDLYAEYKVKDTFTLTTSLYGDAIESQRGLSEGHDYYGYSIGADLHTLDDKGVALSVHQQRYSTDNVRNMGLVKLYYPVMSGVSASVSRKHYINSSPGSDVFFNPEEYTRDDIGINYRLKPKDMLLLSGYVKVGSAKVGGTSDQTYGAKLRLDYLPKNTYISVLTDVSDNSNYRYIIGEVGYKF